MICPHCARTIREEERYLMSRDPDAEPPRWLVHAGWLILVPPLALLFHLILAGTT